MASYAGVTFDEVMSDPTRRPDWSQQVVLVERQIPYANRADVHVVGRGNFRMVVPVTFTSLSGLATLQAAQDGTARTLSLFGASSSAILAEVGQPYRYENEDRWVVDLTFIRQGS